MKERDEASRQRKLGDIQWLRSAQSDDNYSAGSIFFTVKGEAQGTSLQRSVRGEPIPNGNWRISCTIRTLVSRLPDSYSTHRAVENCKLAIYTMVVIDMEVQLV